MIPKILHCCWFNGGKKPELFEKCLASWRHHAPDWEIKEWNLSSLAEISAVPFFCAEAIRHKKWAFASDWARFAIVAAEGGVYLDMDVELVKPIDDLAAEGPFFALSSDDPPWVNPGLGFAAEKGDPICTAIAKEYETMTFDPACHLSQTCPAIVTRILEKYPGRRLLPATVFNPKGSCAGKVCLTPETRAIHHYAASWFNWKQRLAYRILPRLGIDIGPLVRWIRK